MLVGQHGTWSSTETLLYSKVEGRLSSELPMCAMACVNELMRAHTYTHVCTCSDREGRKDKRKESSQGPLATPLLLVWTSLASPTLEHFLKLGNLVN